MDRSMDRNEPQWRINSSFSPPISRRWRHNNRDRLPHMTNVAAIYGSSASSQSRGSRSGLSVEQYPNHHHSVSDGALSYYGSSSENPQAPRWTPPVQRFDLGEFSTPSGGARPEAYVISHSNERGFTSRAPSISSNSHGTPSPLSEPNQWPSSSNKPIFFPPRNFSSRRSFMSKPVYPLVYKNPVSDAEIYESTFSPDFKIQKTLTHSQRAGTSPDPNTSTGRRDGFRWSNASSYEFGFDESTVDFSEHIGLDAPKLNSCVKCALCERPLSQRSPWSTQRIVRSTDMPVSGVLSCCHVFHADCLEETTPKSQMHDPPCPVCQKEARGRGDGSSVSCSEPSGNVVTDGVGSSSGNNVEGDGKRNQSSFVHRRGGGSLLKSHFKKRFNFKGKTSKELFGAKAGNAPSMSSSSSK